jgi:hypothetical protein
VDFGISGVSNIEPDNADAGSLMYLAPEIFQKKKNAVSPALVLFFITGYLGTWNHFV